MSEHESRVRLEADVIPARRLALVALSVIVFGALLVGVAALLLAGARRDLGIPPSATEPTAAPERLSGMIQSPLPGGVGLALRQEGERALGHFAWVDHDAGLVRLPIDIAIERLLAGATPIGVPIASVPAPTPGPAAGVDPRGAVGRSRGGIENGP